MRKKIITISMCVILTCTLIYSYSFLHNYKDYKDNNALKGIPTDVSLILKVDNLNNLIQTLNHEVEYKGGLSEFKGFKLFNDIIDKLDSSEIYNTEIFNTLKRKPLTISFHKEGQNSFTPLFIYEIANKAEFKDISTVITSNTLKKWSINKRKYNSNTIYKIKDTAENFELYLTFDTGLLMISKSSLIIEKSIRQLDTEFSLEKDEIFSKLYKTVSTNSDLNLFINFKNTSEFLDNTLLKKINKHSFLNLVGEWGEFDINFNKENFCVNGFIYPSKEKEKLNLILEGITPSVSRICKFLPSNTTFYFNYNIDNNIQLKNNLNHYLQNTGQLSSFNNKIQKLSFNINAEEYKNKLFKILDNEFCLAYTSNTSSNPNEGKYLLIETISKSKTLKMLSDLINKPITPASTYNLDNETSYPIYHSNGLEGIKYIYSQFLPDPPDKFFTFIDNYLVFANTINSLKSIIYSFELKKTLYYSKYYQQFNENFSYKENLYIYIDISKITSILPNESNISFLNPNKKQQEILSKFYGIGLQISNAKNLLYTNSCVKYLPTREKEPRTVWQSGLDSTIFSKPTLVINHNNQEKEILVQDKSNILYLIANNGKILWQKKLDNPILSEIYQIDYYRNNKLQYLFNTKNKLYLIDRNGNAVEKYPINFRHEATNSISLFDYDKNRNYRIFVACKNKETYAYDKTGKIVKGWKAKTTEGFVNNPIQFFRINNKDYIIFSDDKRNYILNRRGETRVIIKNDFVRNINSLFYQYDNTSVITSDKAGNAKIINLSDGNVTTLTLNNTNEDHYFLYNNISDKKGNEILLLSHNSLNLYTNKGDKVFSKHIEGNISLNADLYYFSSSNIKIGVYDEKNQKIYLLNNDGSIYKNFPLKGKSRFSIGFLSSSSSQFNLIVGGDNNYLYNYQIE